MVYYGQLVIGPPGAGKTTYCCGISQILNGSGRRAIVVNLDPGNEIHSNNGASDELATGNGAHTGSENADNNSEIALDRFTFDIDVRDLVKVEDVMEELGLGPNGALLYCIKLLEKNLSWLQDNIEAQSVNAGQNKDDPPYFIFDLPGQVEIYTHDTTLRDIIKTLTKSKGLKTRPTTASNQNPPSYTELRLCAVQLVDSTYCCTPDTFIAASLSSLCSMIRLEMPMVNILSKIDVLQKMALNTDNEPRPNATHSLPFNLDFYTQTGYGELGNLIPFIRAAGSTGAPPGTIGMTGPKRADPGNKSKAEDVMAKKAFMYRRLHEEICDVLESFSMVSFVPLNINDAQSVKRVIFHIDKAIGYINPKQPLKPSEQLANSIM
eukprot:g3194.t1